MLRPFGIWGNTVGDPDYLLFILNKFVKHFLAITFLFLFLAETFMMSVNAFYVTRNETSVRSNKKFPHRLQLQKSLTLVKSFL